MILTSLKAIKGSLNSIPDIYEPNFTPVAYKNNLIKPPDNNIKASYAQKTNSSDNSTDNTLFITNKMTYSSHNNSTNHKLSMPTHFHVSLSDPKCK